MKYHGSTSHGYRFVFRKLDDTRAYLASTIQGSLYSVLDVRLDIMPISNGLREAAMQIPIDLPDGPRRSALTAVAFRGLLTPNERLEFRPESAITRREFACALARSANLNAPKPPVPAIEDVTPDTMEGDEIARVVGAGLMDLHPESRFGPDENLAVGDAVRGLEKLAQLSHSVVEEDTLAAIHALAQRPQPLTRGDVGCILHQILELPE